MTHDAGRASDLLARRLMLDGLIKKRVFASTGNREDKEKVLRLLGTLVAYNVDIYATEGTSTFLSEHGISNIRVAKIREGGGENAETLLSSLPFDLVINILTGDAGYDEQSDARIIRTLASQHRRRLVTDVEVAIAEIKETIADIERDRADADDERDMWKYFARLVHERGGYANYHAHFDKAYLVRPRYLELGQIDMQAKWELYKRLKEGEEYSPEKLYERMEQALCVMIRQGVTYCRTHVDADSTVGLKCVRAALDLKTAYANQIRFDIGIQPLEGLRTKATRDVFEEACALADVVGGLPSRDRPAPREHLDIILRIAKNLGKRLDVHVDQENNPEEDETEMLADMVEKHGMEGKVCAIHAISLACQPKVKRQEVSRKLRDRGMGVIICPSAALSMKQLDKIGPLHNSIAPLEELRQAGVALGLGTDNISDFFMPDVNGDMRIEVHLLKEACRTYDYPGIADIACTTAFIP